MLWFSHRLGFLSFCRVLYHKNVVFVKHDYYIFLAHFTLDFIGSSPLRASERCSLNLFTRLHICDNTRVSRRGVEMRKQGENR